MSFGIWKNSKLPPPLPYMSSGTCKNFEVSPFKEVLRLEKFRVLPLYRGSGNQKNFKLSLSKEALGLRIISSFPSLKRLSDPLLFKLCS